jgi:cytosine deaminase
MGIEGGTIVGGAPADLVLVRAAHVPEAVAGAPPRTLVMKAGRVVARDGALAGQPPSAASRG